MKIKFEEIKKHIQPVNLLSYYDNIVAAYLVYLIQKLPLSANIISLFSIIVVISSIIALLVFNYPILFHLLLIVAYTLDNTDGIWARIKNEISQFGSFFDGFLDSIKYILIESAFIIYHYDYLKALVENQLYLIIFFSIYFSLRELYSASFIKKSPLKTEETKKIIFDLTSGATRFFIIFPLVIYVKEVLIIYFLSSFGMFTLKIIQFVSERYKTKR